jgi:hypothetical protein
VTFSIEDHRILIAPAQLQQEALSPQVFSIDSDPSLVDTSNPAMDGQLKTGHQGSVRDW